jgi:hypothetical protein
MKLFELEKGTTLISARVNTHLISLLKEGEIPVSMIVEKMLTYFFTLPDEDKIKYVNLYDSKNIEIENIKYPKKVWSALEQPYTEGINIRELLMYAAEEDLKILTGYLDAGDLTEEVQSNNEENEQYRQVTEILNSLRINAREIFKEKLEYGEIVSKAAESLGVEVEKITELSTSQAELVIVKKFLLNKFLYIPPQEKQEMFKILGRPYMDSQTIFLNIAINDLPEIVLYKLMMWLAEFILQVAQEAVNKHFSDSMSRKMIFPILHITMLRHKYRYEQTPKCSVCQTAIIQGTKFCGECGARL